MRLPRAVSIGAVVCGMAITIWSLSRLLRSPIFPRSSAQPTVATTPAQADASAGSQPSGSTTYWHDPSVDPEVLAKAFAPPPANLPATARPKPSNIHPSPREWRRLQEQQNAVAY
jgi:hypothetical protein